LRQQEIASLEMIFRQLVANYCYILGIENTNKKLGHLNLIDSTTISLCLSRYPWAEFRRTKSGIKVHLRLRFCKRGCIPADAIVTVAKPADKTQMDKLIVEEQGALNVFDRGYVDYKKFDSYCEKGILFVTRLKSNATVTTVSENPVEEGSSVIRDQVAYLGKVHKMEHPLRLVETTDAEGKPVIIATDDFTASANEISDIYRYRWKAGRLNYSSNGSNSTSR